MSRVQGPEFRLRASGSRVLGLRAQGLGLRAQGLGLKG